MDIFLGPSVREYFLEQPLTLIDVGARGGLQPNWNRAREHLKLVGFEPDPEEHARLARSHPNALYINAALHRAPAELTLNVGREGGTSSLLQPDWEYLNRFPDPRRYEVVRRVTMKADSLDRVLSEHGVRDADFLKIDTQGAELAIIEGAGATLSDSVFGVELEVLFGRLYVGQPRFGQLDDALHALDFQLMDLRPSYWKRAAGARLGGPKGQIAFADALYLKTERRFQEELERMTDLHRRRAKLLRAMSICLLYGYVDYAVELFGPNRELFEASSASEIARELESDVRFSTRLPHFRGRGFLSGMFYRLHRLFFPTRRGWASADPYLGNVE